MSDQAQPTQKVTFRAILLLTSVAFGFLFVFTSVYVLKTEGTGMIEKLVNRGGHGRDDRGNRLPSGLFARLDDGTEIQIPPTSLWHDLKRGDHISKRQWSFVYVVNGTKHHGVTHAASFALVLAGIGFALWTSGFCISKVMDYRNRKTI